MEPVTVSATLSPLQEILIAFNSSVVYSCSMRNITYFNYVESWLYLLRRTLGRFSYVELVIALATLDLLP